MSSLSCHVLDTMRGRPASGIVVSLAQLDLSGAWQALTSATTNGDGRVQAWPDPVTLGPGTYRVRFETRAYFSPDTAVFYPFVDVVFDVGHTSEHFHIPLLLSAYGYTTYRGS